MSKNVSVIQTALTTTLPLELTYRAHRPEFAAPDGNLYQCVGDHDFAVVSNSDDSLEFPPPRTPYLGAGDMA